jgi:enoyl-CoA hydratase
LGGSACRLPRQIPYTVAMDILLSARAVTAHEAQQIGLIGRVVPDGQALPVARAVAAQVAECGPLSTVAILRAWRETEHMTDLDAMQHQDKIGWEVFASEDAKEGPRAFAEKRKPEFKGR